MILPSACLPWQPDRAANPAQQCRCYTTARGMIHVHGALPVPSSLLSFVPGLLRVTRVLPSPDHVTIEAQPRPVMAECPTCGLASRRIHSFYRRVLHDLPWQGRPVTIRVAARRFRCFNQSCSRQTFAERLDGVMAASSRRIGRLLDLHRHLALALGGEAGARLAVRLAIATSPDMLLRLVSTQSAHGAAKPTPRVLGIDDWAWRRGHHYGTMLVNLETNEVVDLLPDREAATVAKWLRAHPGVRIPTKPATNSNLIPATLRSSRQVDFVIS
jgi:transposase